MTPPPGHAPIPSAAAVPRPGFDDVPVPHLRLYWFKAGNPQVWAARLDLVIRVGTMALSYTLIEQFAVGKEAREKEWPTTLTEPHGINVPEGADEAIDLIRTQVKLPVYATFHNHSQYPYMLYYDLIRF